MKRSSQYQSIAKKTLGVLGLFAQVSIHGSTFQNNSIASFKQMAAHTLSFNQNTQFGSLSSNAFKKTFLLHYFSNSCAHTLHKSQIKGFITQSSLNSTVFGLQALINGRHLALKFLASEKNKGAVELSIQMNKSVKNIAMRHVQNRLMMQATSSNNSNAVSSSRLDELQIADASLANQSTVADIQDQLLEDALKGYFHDEEEHCIASYTPEQLQREEASLAHVSTAADIQDQLLEAALKRYFERVH